MTVNDCMYNSYPLSLSARASVSIPWPDIGSQVTRPPDIRHSLKMLLARLPWPENGKSFATAKITKVRHLAPTHRKGSF